MRSTPRSSRRRKEPRHGQVQVHRSHDRDRDPETGSAASASRPLLALPLAAGNRAVTSLVGGMRAAAGAPRQMDEDQEEIGQSGLPGQAVARCADEEGTGPEQPVGPEGGAVPQAVAERIEARRGGGSSLEGGARQDMELAFGTSFDDVRVHADDESDRLNQHLGAAAFTVGSDIFFSGDTYRPGSRNGRHVLAHELTHVVQQRGAGSPGPLTVGRTDDASEREADRVAAQVDRITSRRAEPVANRPSVARPTTAADRLRGEMATFRAEHSRSATASLATAIDGGSRASPAPYQQIRRMGRASPTPPSLGTIMTNATVKAAIENAWKESKPNAPAVPKGQPGSKKKEQGGWIIWNSKDDTYRIERVPAGTRDGLGTIVGTRPNVKSPEVLVAWFHTHPNTTAEGYSPKPSPPDKSFTKNYAKVPGIVRAHDGYHKIPYP